MPVCPYCAGDDVVPSRRRGRERWLRPFHGRDPWRCRSCWSRFWTARATRAPGRILAATALVLAAVAAVLVVLPRRPEPPPPTVQRRPVPSRPPSVRPPATPPVPAETTAPAEGPPPALPPPTPAPPGQRLAAIYPLSMADRFRLILLTDRPVTQWRSFRLADPPRRVLDLAGEWIGPLPETVPVRNGVVRSVRLGRGPGRLRLVMDLACDRVGGTLIVDRQDQGLVVTLPLDDPDPCRP